MKTRLATAVLLAATFVAAEDRAPQIKVGPNVLVSKDHPELFHAEIVFAADPVNPNRLLGAAMGYDLKIDKDRTAGYVSVDGGKTWKATLLTGESVDPAVAYGLNGTAYFVHLNRGADGGMEILRSKNGGLTWLPPVVETYLDREFITVDDTRGKYRGRLYINAHEAGDEERKTRVLTLMYSKDGGAKWSDVVDQPGKPAGMKVAGNGVVLSDGTFCSVFLDQIRSTADPKAGLRRLAGWIGLSKSTDGGKTISEPVKIADWYYPTGERHLAYIPFLAVDRSAGRFRDRLYAVWVDTRSRRAQILLSWSADKGKTWSEPKAVEDNAARADGKGPDDHHPAVAVNKDGVVGVTWYDRREAEDNLGWRARFAASADGGVRFTPSVAVSEAAYEPARNQPSAVNDMVDRVVRNTGAHFQYPRWGFVYNGGDTAGIAAGPDGILHAFWTDNRTGSGVQIWTSAVRVDVPAGRSTSQ